MADQESKKGATSAATPTLQDFVLPMLQEAVKPVVDLNEDSDRSEQFSKALESFIDDLMPPNPTPVPDNDKCKNPDFVTKPFCAQLKQSEAQADSAFGIAENSAASTLYGSVNAWTLAVSTYETGLDTASAALQAAVQQAIDAYNASMKQQPDSASRSLSLWYTLKIAVVSAVQQYISSVASASATLAGAAGAAITEYATYASGITSAEATRANALSAATQAYWQSVETGRDH